MEKKLKVGEIVYIRKNLEVKEYNGLNFVPQMFLYCGKKARIVAICGSYYEINIDNCSWMWSINMFEKKEVIPEVFGIVNFCKKYY